MGRYRIWFIYLANIGDMRCYCFFLSRFYGFSLYFHFTCKELNSMLLLMCCCWLRCYRTHQIKWFTKKPNYLRCVLFVVPYDDACKVIQGDDNAAWRGWRRWQRLCSIIANTHWRFRLHTHTHTDSVSHKILVVVVLINLTRLQNVRAVRLHKRRESESRAKTKFVV